MVYGKDSTITKRPVLTKSPIALAKVHQVWRGKKSGTDGLPDSHRRLISGAIVMAERSSAGTLPGTDRPNNYINATTYRAFSALPYTRKKQAIV
jgi:hypothetical protein